jgi:PAS domain S-box-containing protein
MKFAELVDIDELRELCQSFTATTGAVTALLDLDGNVLIATGWQRVCTQFHRVAPATAARCLESDTVLAGQLRKGAPFNLYQCKNGLVDVAVPVIVGGEHVANLFTGQFFLEPPDRASFAQRARENGFGEEAYLAALGQVPVFSEAHVRALMDFLGRLARVFGEIGLSKRRLEETVSLLRESEQRFSFALDATRDGVWDWDVESGRVHYSPNYLAMLGYRPGELPSELGSWQDRLHPDDRAKAQEANRACIAGETDHFEVEFRMRHRDGEWRWILGRGSVVTRREDGRALRMVGTHTDVTARKLAEENQRSLEAQLAQAGKLESIGRLAGGVAHDFNNMLGVILGRAEIALEQLEPTHPLFEDLVEIRAAAQRSANLTRQLLAFARKQTATPKVLALNETLAGMLNMLRRLIGENLELAWRPGDELWPIRIDPSQIDQILTNLCVNARDALDGKGAIEVATSNVVVDDEYCARRPDATPGEFVKLSVRDDGHGMKPETLEHLFEPFFTEKEVGKGTGLGLATVFGIVRQNDGFIEVRSELGAGSTFEILLPRFVGDRAPASTDDRPAVAPGGHQTVLLVEDEPALRRVARDMLQKLGYRVLCAGSPEEAIELARRHPADLRLLVTDVVMPGMNGRELAERLRAARPELECLFMSGYTADIIAHQGVVDPRAKFLHKPFSMSELGRTIDELLRVR